MLIGIVGKPSSGKSTFFKACTLAEVAIAPHPFTTIKPNHGIGFVKIPCPEKDFNVKCKPKFGYCLNANRFVPVDMLDVAGLVPGAHAGKGLGNAFLDDLRQADCLIHVVDASGGTNENGEPVSDFSYDPCKDITFLEEELDLWILGLLKKDWNLLVRKAKVEKQNIIKLLAEKFSGLKINETHIKAAIKKLNLPEDVEGWNDNEVALFCKEMRKISKPIIIAANKADVPEAYEKIKRMKEKFPDYVIIPCSAESELALKEAARHDLINYIPGEKNFEIKNNSALTEEQKKALEFIKNNVLERYSNTGIQQVLNTAVFEILKYIAVFPVPNAKLQDKEGNILPDCFLMPPESTALDLAYAIHSDIGKNFIKAIDIRTGKIVGKDHKLKHLDVVEIVTK